MWMPTLFAFGLLAGALLGQPERVASLEAQRAAWRAMRAAEAGGDAGRAARLIADILTLPHRVPNPFSSTDDRLALIERARRARRAEEMQRAEGLLADSNSAAGEPCPACDGRGAVLCETCSGAGFMERAVGRRVERHPCAPLVRCAPCNGSGRKGDVPVGKALAQVHTSVAAYLKEVNQSARRLKGLPDHWKKVAGTDAAGVIAPYGDAAALRAITGAMPSRPDDLADEPMRRFSLQWGRLDWTGKHDFVRATILESLAYRRLVEAIDPSVAAPIGKGRDDPDDVAPDLLALAPERHVGRWLRLRLSPIPDPGRPARPAPVPPFDGLVDFAEIDRSLLAAYYLTDADRERLKVAVQTLGLSGLARLSGAYPRKNLDRVFASEEPLSVTARLVPQPLAAPAFALQIWDAAP